MNDAWRQSDADAHEAKAEALEMAIEHLSGCRAICSTPVDGMIAQTLIGLQKEADGHRRSAKLVAA